MKIRASLSLIIGLITALASASLAGPGYFSLGLKFQNGYQLYYENGFELGYTHDMLLSRRLQVKVDYVTTRLGSALNKEALNQHYLTGALSFNFRPQKRVDPYIKLNYGQYWFETEHEMFSYMDNTSVILAPVFGVNFNMLKYGSFYMDMGYNIYTAATLYPLFFSVGINVNIFPGLFK